MLMGYTVYEIVSLFFVYGFLGWCVEVAYCALEEGYFSNRGFLNGPICPIYGVGGTMVAVLLTPLEHNLFYLFIGSALLTTVLELVTGFALDKLFHTHWWDYSEYPFNIGGYICLKFSIYWGLACVGMMKLVHPAIRGLVRIVPHIIGIIVLAVLGAVFIADLVITVITITKLTKRMKLMDDIANKIHAISDNIGEKVYDGTIKAKDRGDDLKDKYDKEISELKEKYAGMVGEKHFLQSRLIKAFPDMKSRRHNEQLEKLKEKIKLRRNKK